MLNVLERKGVQRQGEVLEEIRRRQERARIEPPRAEARERIGDARQDRVSFLSARDLWQRKAKGDPVARSPLDERRSALLDEILMVPGGGVEPPRAEAHESLSLARLPVPPARRVSLVTQGREGVKARQARVPRARPPGVSA